jgi:CHAT domain-containing protein
MGQDMLPPDSLSQRFEEALAQDTAAAEACLKTYLSHAQQLMAQGTSSCVQARAYFTVLQDLAIRIGTSEVYVQASISIAGILTQIGQYELAYQVYLKPTLDSTLRHIPDQQSMIWYQKLTMAVYLFETGRQQAGFDLLTDLLDQSDHLKQSMNQVDVGDQITAYEESKIPGKLNIMMWSAHNAMGSAYLLAGDFPASLFHYDSALWYTKQPLNANAEHDQIFRKCYQAATLDNLGMTHRQLGQLDLALASHQEALARGQGVEDMIELSTMYLNLGETYLAANRLQEAFTSFHQSIDRLPEVSLAALPYSYLPLARLFLQTDQLDSALAYSHAVLEAQARQQPFSTKPTQVFAVDDLILDFRLVTGLIYQARVWTRKAMADQPEGSCPAAVPTHPKALSALRQAHATHLLLSEVVDSLRRINYFSASDGGYNLADTIAVALDEAVQVAYLLGQADPSQQEAYWQSALRFSEAGKYNVLYYEWRQAEQGRNSNVPQVIRDREALINSQLRYQQTLLFGQSEAVRDSLRGPLDSLLAERQALIQQLQTEYPSYYRLIYQSLDLSLASLRRQLLGEQEAIVEYDQGANALYTFLITPTQFTLRAIYRDSLLDATMVSMYRNLATPQPHELTAQAVFEGYARPAHQLYQRLLAPEQATLRQESEQRWRLCVIGDGLLRSLNFAALLTALPHPDTELDAYARWPYLLRDSSLTLSYANSLTLALGQRHRQVPDTYLGEYLGLAAWYRHHPLAVAIESVRQLGQRDWNGPTKVLLGSEEEPLALKDFFALAPGYRILQLAMHGEADSLQPFNSALLFSDEVRLTAAAIDTLRLFAELVILDACETGLGQVQRGEGILSLARAFAYAGATASLVSQYQIDAEASQLLVEEFLAHLRAGKRKDDAWHMAQLAFFNRWEKDRLPHYWAGLMPVGDMAPLGHPRGTGGIPWWGWLISGALLGSAMGIWLRRRQMKKGISEV